LSHFEVHQVPNPLNRCKSQLALALGLLLAAPSAASAQANVTATRGAEIVPFALTSSVSPDWYPKRNLGFTLGVDYTRLFNRLVQPSLELRYTNADGQNAGEQSFTAGLKLATKLRFVHPYFTLLGGTGLITLHNPAGYPTDNAYIYAFGGGAEVDVYRNWRVAADYQQQNWDLEPVKLTPTIFSLGVSYSIPFHRFSGVH
jgi:Outer membrane protein beta-barrel domain